MRNNIKINPKLNIPKLEGVYSEPITIRVNKFDEENLTNFTNDFEDAVNTGQPVIPIVIDSYGGSCYGVIGMINLIETSPVPIATILMSKAMSAGAILFCFGTDGYRYMHPEATLMIHDAGSGSHGKVEEMKVDVNQLDDLNQRIYKRASKHLGHDPSYLGKLIKEHHHVDWFLNSQEAKKHKIANHLKLPNFNIEIELKVSFG